MRRMARNYMRASLDRFGDDLCEVLLSYLSFKEQFRLECMSKQWKRTVHQKQYHLSITTDLFPLDDFGNETQSINLKALDFVLRKCPNIGSVYCKYLIDNKEEVFELLDKYCLNLTQIYSDFNGLTENRIKQFCHKFGPNLKKIHFHSNHESNQLVLSLCPNLTVVDIRRFTDISVFDQKCILFNKLKDISIAYCCEDSNRIGILVENNKTNLESIDISVQNYSVKPIDLRILFNELSKLLNLKAFVFVFNKQIDYIFVDLLRNFAKKCPKLEKLDLCLNISSLSLICEVFKSINYFKQLKKLVLNWFGLADHSYDNSLQLSSKAWNECQNLKHLTFNLVVIRVNDEFFDNIDKYLPKLQFIYCSNTSFSVKTLKSLSGLSDLRSVYLHSSAPELPFTASQVFEFVDKLPKIKSIYLRNRIFRTELTFEELEQLRRTGISDNKLDLIKYESDSETEESIDYCSMTS